MSATLWVWITFLAALNAAAFLAWGLLARARPASPETARGPAKQESDLETETQADPLEELIREAESACEPERPLPPGEARLAESMERWRRSSSSGGQVRRSA